MVNFGFGLGTILGIALALSGVGLYFLRTLRPNLARDHDIFFAAVALLCGGILVFQSWRLDPILQFAQFLSIGSAVWFAYEAIRLRGITTEQAKRSTPIIDDERPISRRYRAELDDLTPLDEQRTVTRRIQGSRDSREENYGESDEGRRRSGGRGRDDYEAGDRSRRSRSSRPLPGDRTDNYRDDNRADDYRGDDYRGDDYRSGDYRPDSAGSWNSSDQGDPSGSGMRESIRDSSFSSPSSSARPSRKSTRPAPSPRRRGGSASDSDYVDYKPVNYTDGETDAPKDEWR